MKNKNSILILIEKSTNAFGELKGLTEDEKLKAALTIIEDTIQTAFGIDPTLLRPNTITDILKEKQPNIEQTSMLSKLLWTQAEILLKLKQPFASLTNRENSLLVSQWQTYPNIERNYLEKQNEITELKELLNHQN